MSDSDSSMEWEQVGLSPRFLPAHRRTLLFNSFIGHFYP